MSFRYQPFVKTTNDRTNKSSPFLHDAKFSAAFFGVVLLKRRSRHRLGLNRHHGWISNTQITGGPVVEKHGPVACKGDSE